MRRPYAQNRSRMVRVSSSPRIVSMLVMLMVLGMIIYRAGDPATWRWLAPGDDEPVETAPLDPKPAVSVSAAPSSQPSAESPKLESPKQEESPNPETPKLVATGPTDEDADEKSFMEEAKLAITDGTLGMKREDMVAYNRVLGWVQNQPVELLRKRARGDVLYDQFLRDPEAMRFKLVKLDLNVARIVRCDVKGPGDSQLYEVRGHTAEGGPMLYFAVVDQLPKGMPIGLNVQQRAKLVGYFFKLQAYHSQASMNSKLTKPLRAPMVIGRLIWDAPPAPSTMPSFPDWVWATILIVAAALVIGFVMFKAKIDRSRPMPSLALNRNIDPDAPPIDEWLDRTVRSEDEPADDGGSSNGKNGYGGFGSEGPDDGDLPRFPGGFDRIGR